MASPTASGDAENPTLHSRKRHWHRKPHLRDSLKRSVAVVTEKGKHWSQDVSIIRHLLWAAAKFIFGLLKCLVSSFRVKSISQAGWQMSVSSTVCNILYLTEVPLREFGKAIEGIGNRYLGQYKATNGKEVPRTIIGLLDTEVPALCKNTVEVFPSPTPGSRPNGDVCVTAAKIVYEEEEIVKDVINNVWNTKAVEDGKVQDLKEPPEERFEFVHWFDSKKNAPSGGGRAVDTQAMIFRKGRAIVLAFRGTQPFSAVDWATDFYFPWWELPAVGRVHTGFLQALGLGSPKDADPPKSDSNNKKKESDKLNEFSKYMKRHVKDRACATAAAGDDAKTRKESRKSKNESFEKKYAEETLYFQLRDKLQRLLDEDDRNHLFITGHSLGGALAALFTGLLVAESDALEKRISGLFTFGQPRIGDWTFAWFLHSRLNGPQHRYVRMIYGYDLVPHVPFDTDLFEFKHLGPFHWVDPFYHIRIGTFEDQPRLNVFTAHFRAAIEFWYNTSFNWFANWLIRAPKKQRLKEGFFQKLSRAAVLLPVPFLPTLGAHSPVNYVNAVRYGMPEGKVKEAPASGA